MKNLVITAVFALATMTAFAQETETMEEDMPQEETMAEEAQEGFSEVSMDEVPQPIMDTVKENYPNATLNKVHVNEEMQYKLEATMEDGTEATMMMDAEGNAIEG